MQEYKKRIVQCVLADKIIPMDLKNWLVFHSLEPEFISEIHVVLLYSNHEAIIVMKDQNVYSLTYLKPRNMQTILTAIRPKKIKELCGKNIKMFAHGTFFILALTVEGKVYSCTIAKKRSERNDWYDFIKMIIPEESTFTQVTSLSEKRIVNIACGYRHCLALTNDGKVYAWGHNDYGQVGNENTDSFISVPWEVKYQLKNKNVIHIACGLEFNIVTTDENKIYGWGNNSLGQISILQSQICYVYPHEIATISDKIVKVTCGGWHTLALTNKGDIYAWGSNKYGQIGINNDRRSSPPIMVNRPEMGKVLDIAAFYELSGAVGYDKIVYIWGRFCCFFISNIPFPMKLLTIHDVYACSGRNMISMPSTGFTNIGEELNILESIGAAFDDSLTGDFTIQVEGRPIYVHKAILKIRCEYFRNMFRHDWVENNQSKSGSSILIVDQFSYIVYKAFLKYLYVGTIDLPSENALELLELADMYCETNLLKDCSKIIEKSITISNVAFFYYKAVEYNAKELVEFCLQFADTFEDIKLDMNMLTKFMYKAAIQSRASRGYCRKSFVPWKRYVEKRNSRTNKKHKMQLLCVLAKKIISMYLGNWPFFRFLEPEFIIQIHMVMTFRDGDGDAVIIVTKDKNVYGLIRSGDIDVTAVCPKKIKELCGKNIKTFACGDGFILALTGKGEVYSYHFADSLNSMIIPKDVTFTQVVGLNQKCVVNIACGYRYCLALTNDGKVYAWKCGDYWSNKCDKSVAFCSVPRQMKHELENENVIHIACGSKFNIVVTDENKIYGWGDNSLSQISTIQSQICYVYPHEIATISDKIVKVTCGDKHTLALTNKGDIYAWGNNKDGQIGVDNKSKLCGPIMVNRPEIGKVLDIAALRNLSVAVGYDKIIYIWGRFCISFILNIPFPTKFLTIHDVFAHHFLKIMHKPLTVFTNIEEELNILESIGAAFDDSLTGDFTIQVEGRPIYVHKAILKIRCEYFRNMFRHDWVENSQSKSNSSILTVDQFSYIVYKAFLKYLYVGTIDLPSENVLELLELADMYCETNLLKDCCKIIEKSITVSNVAFFYDKAIEYNAKELEEFCVHFALCHIEDVVL